MGYCMGLGSHHPLGPVYSVQRGNYLSVLDGRLLFSQSGGRWGKEGTLGLKNSQ